MVSMVLPVGQACSPQGGGGGQASTRDQSKTLRQRRGGSRARVGKEHAGNHPVPFISQSLPLLARRSFIGNESGGTL